MTNHRVLLDRDGLENDPQVLGSGVADDVHDLDDLAVAGGIVSGEENRLVAAVLQDVAQLLGELRGGDLLLVQENLILRGQQTITWSIVVCGWSTVALGGTLTS